jgi:hypothetical protein
MTDEQAMAATAALLEIAMATPLRPGRETWSGLVRQQELLHRGRAGQVSPTRGVEPDDGR